MQPPEPTLSPTEQWSNPSGWTVQIPVGWEGESDGPEEGFVPPDALGRLSIFTLQAHETVDISDEFTREQAARILPKASRLPWKRSAPDVVERLGVDHLAVARSGRADGRAFYAVVHVFPPRLTVYALWHTRDRDDPRWADGVAAARSIAPM